jgi:hypothetical protein
LGIALVKEEHFTRITRITRITRKRQDTAVVFDSWHESLEPQEIRKLGVSCGFRVIRVIRVKSPSRIDRDGQPLR